MGNRPRRVAFRNGFGGATRRQRPVRRTVPHKVLHGVDLIEKCLIAIASLIAKIVTIGVILVVFFFLERGVAKRIIAIESAAESVGPDRAGAPVNRTLTPPIQQAGP